MLSDVRVLDLGRYIAAPYCSLILADLGAEVIRVERPGGELDRRLGLCASHGESFLFTALARNKKGITLDLRAGGAAHGVLLDLAAHSDVLLHNFSPAGAATLGLAHAEICSVRPDIVYAAISSYGSRGPGAARTGFDPIIQMASGAASTTGSRESGPVRCGVPWVDYGTGLSAAVGILAALRRRDRTGAGQQLECSLLRTALSFTAPMVAEATVAGRPRPALGNQAAYVSVSNLFPCADGHVYIVAVSSGSWRALTALVGAPEWAEDETLRTPAQRYEQRERIDRQIAAWTRGRSVSCALAQLEHARIPCGAYRDSGELGDDPQVLAEGMLRYVDLETDELDRVPTTALPLSLSELEPPAAARPPRLGEHNAEVYAGLLGYGPERLEELTAAGVI
jgi:crotonobetainyl-CoA:carnitine CoA-transferase CaiB-like acyl-CoA transferase